MTDARWNSPWADRPPEEARNLNPAFCAELIARVVGDFHTRRRAPLGIALAFVALPLTLHKLMRDALPRRANAAFGSWIADNNALLVQFPALVKRLRPVSREALIFAIHSRLLAIESSGLVPGVQPVRIAFRPDTTTDDVEGARAAAAFLGRWFAGQATEVSILLGLGVAP